MFFAGLTALFKSLAPFAAVGSAVGGLMMGQRSAEAQKKAQAAQSQMNQLEAHKARVQAVREARIKRAQLLSESTMGEGTSGIAGGTSSIASQLGSNIGFQNVRQDIGTRISNANQESINASANQQMFGTIFSVANQATDWQKIFKPEGIKTYV